MGSSNFEITNINALLSDIGQLVQENENVARIYEQIIDCKNQISNAWISDTEDKTSYLGSLSDNLDKLEKLCTAIRGLNNTLTTFAENAQRQSNNA